MQEISYKKKINNLKKMREDFRISYSNNTNSLTKEINDAIKQDCILEFPKFDMLLVINYYNYAFMEFDPIFSLFVHQQLIYSKDMLQDIIDTITCSDTIKSFSNNALYKRIENFSNNSFMKYNVPVYIFHKAIKFEHKNQDLFNISKQLKEFQ